MLRALAWLVAVSAWSGAGAGCELVFRPSGSDLADGGGDGPPTGTFAPPVKLAVSSDFAEDDDPSLTGDLLELYFSSDRVAGAFDIWRSTRASITSPWEPPVLVVELSSPANEGPPEVSPDGLTITLSSNRNMAGTGDDIYIATRATRGEAWSAPVEVAELSTEFLDVNASLSGDGLAVVVTRDVDPTAGVDRDIYHATRGSRSSAFDTPIALEGFANPGVRDSNAMLLPDGLVLVLDTDRPGSDGIDIWIARRPDPDVAFDPPTRIDELATASNEGDPWLSADQQYLVFSSTKDGTSDIYETWRQ